MRRNFFVVITLLLCIYAKGLISNFNHYLSSLIYENGDRIVNNTYQIFDCENLENLSLFHRSGLGEGFRGKFHGNNKQIHNLVVEGKYRFTGLFAFIGPGASTDNLHIASTRIKGNEINYLEASTAVGSIAAKAASGGDASVTKHTIYRC